MNPSSGDVSRPMPRASGCGLSVTRVPPGASSITYRPLGRSMPAQSPSKATSRGASTRTSRTVESNVWPIAFET
jgi:hypothetical protein